ncbi:hypothetical protein P170DRAFT_509728 [Aspergillus steynii IBT 23096]|uniref:Uncharacterized protein n=1 Tax=Aspergillus steynii IBT 23096 TaxID=1392250 RepID=A0A2I2G899_9EURO|nr:uncharacterized protein P170DRAFT_509728 [Aspergillus steynii IBT 23096]PLB49106.1 hypothetical protein P170DRAFT_509728 [Aspergillus steynii IBT 23096]
MGWDISALAPGPAGTVMIGEKGGIEGIARRARERRKREAEEQELGQGIREQEESASDKELENTLITKTQENGVDRKANGPVAVSDDEEQHELFDEFDDA